MSGSASPTRVFLVGFYGVRNLGDEAILETIDRAAGRLGARVIAYAARRDLDDPRAVRLRGRGVLRYLRACAAADRVVLGGGGILKDEGLGLPLELLLTAAVARLCRRPVALLAVGVGPFYTRLGRLAIGWTARLASVRTVRDEASARRLRELGVGGVEVCADPVFSGAWEVGTARDRGPTAGSESGILLALRPWFHLDGERGPRRWSRLRDGMAEAIRELVRRGWTVHLACLYWPEDRDVAEQVVRRCGADRTVTIDAAPRTWPELVHSARTAEVVVAMRYHALAAAAVAGRPVIALPYEPKVRSLAAELGVTAIAVDDPAAGELILQALDGDPDRLRAGRGAVEELRRRAWRGLELALTPQVRTR